MSTVKHESEVKLIPYPQQLVYDKLSDLNNLAFLKQIVTNPMVMQKLKEQANLDDKKVEQIVNTVNNMQFDCDSVTIQAPMVGEIRISVLEREEPKCIKLTTGQHPLPATFWVQLLPHGDSQCRMRLTGHAEVNFFMKKMVEKPLKQGVDGIANALSMLPYSMLNF